MLDSSLEELPRQGSCGAKKANGKHPCLSVVTSVNTTVVIVHVEGVPLTHSHQRRATLKDGHCASSDPRMGREVVMETAQLPNKPLKHHWRVFEPSGGGAQVLI